MDHIRLIVVVVVAAAFFTLRQFLYAFIRQQRLTLKAKGTQNINSEKKVKYTRF